MPVEIRMSRFTCFIVFLSAIVCLAITNRSSNVTAASQAGNTVDQTRKNIQVLKGLPDAPSSSALASDTLR
jgi:hypothetical protein